MTLDQLLAKQSSFEIRLEDNSLLMVYKLEYAKGCENPDAQFRASWSAAPRAVHEQQPADHQIYAYDARTARLAVERAINERFG